LNASFAKELFTFDALDSIVREAQTVEAHEVLTNRLYNHMVSFDVFDELFWGSDFGLGLYLSQCGGLAVKISSSAFDHKIY
jgi:hypothetical protein